MLPGCELLLLYSMGYSGIELTLAFLLSSKVLGVYLVSVNLLARAFLSALRCSSLDFLALTAAQLPICLARSSSSISWIDWQEIITVVIIIHVVSLFGWPEEV